MLKSPGEPHDRVIAHRTLDGAFVPFLNAGLNLCGRLESRPWGYVVTFRAADTLPSALIIATRTPRNYFDCRIMPM
jgi:hypothetical protein